MSGRHRGRPLPRRLRAAGLSLLLAAVLAAVLAGVCGVRLLPVLTGSIAPYAPTGSLVLTTPLDGTEVAEGDVVAFRPPPPFEISGDHPVLHRVTTLGTDDGRPWMVTKGDANRRADPWRVSLSDADLGRTVLVVPLLGRLLAGGTWAALALVLGGAALLAGARAARTDACACSPTDA